MSVLGRFQELLPPPLTLDAESVLTRLLDVIALEVEALREDLERVRQTHWIRTVFRLEEAEKLGALLDIPRLDGEGLELYRERLLAMAVARLQGAIGANEVRRFLYDYLTAAERALGATLVVGLQQTAFENAFRAARPRPAFRPLALVENPVRRRTSATLATRRNRVPYLFRWTESNAGLDVSVAEFELRGLFGGHTAVPILVNLTSGELIGYRDVLRFGQRLRLRLAAGPDARTRKAAATLDGADVTDRTFSMAGFELGVPFRLEDLDPAPRLPQLVRGENAWTFVSVAHFDVRGLDHAFLAMAGESLREGVFDETSFDDALFPSGPLVWLSMEWDETEPAAFEARIPRTVVVEPEAIAGQGAPHDIVERGLTDAVRQLHAAGVRAGARFVPFGERQRQRERFELPFRVFAPERGPSGVDRGARLGGRFGETRLGESRFE